MVRWVVLSGPVSSLYSYATYVRIMYVLAVAMLLVVLGVVYLTWAMHHEEPGKGLRRFAKLLQLSVDVLFGVVYITWLGKWLACCAACYAVLSGKVYIP